MSVYGIETRRADQSVMVNGLSRGGVFIEILSLPGGGSGTKSYPGTGGSSLYFYTASAARHTVSVGTDASGNGCINWTATDASSNTSTVIYVFASKLITSDTYGVKVINNQGETLADQGYPAPQYLGKVSLNATAIANYTTPDGYTAYLHSTPNFTLQDASDKVVLLAMPDSGTDDTWYAVNGECIQANAGLTNVLVTVYTKAASYTIPTLHVYAINHPTPSNSTYAVQLKTASQALTWDSSVESVSIRDTLTINYPAAGATNTYSLAVTNLPGLLIPFYYQADYSGSTSTRYVGCAKKVGFQVTFGLIKDAQSSSSPVIAAYKLGSQTGRYCPVVDLSQLGPAAPAGTPGGANWSAPSFTTQPAPAPRCKPGETLALTVAVAGNPTPTLQWYKNGAAIAGATSTTYSKVADSSDDQAKFYCVAHNILVDTQSTVSTATVNNNVAPVITGKTGNLIVRVGTSVTVSITASGTPAPAYSITGPGNLSSSTNSLTFTPSTYGDYQFDCIATNSEGQAETIITITAANAPSYATQPADQTVTAGGTASFTVELGSDTVTNTSIDWYKNGTKVTASPSTSTTYSFPASLSDNGAQVYCIATNSVGSTQSRTATLTVTQAPTPPSFVSGPTATNCDQGGNTTLSCSVNGYPAPTVTWKQGVTTLGTGTSLTVAPSGTGNQVITCTLSNASGTTSANVTIFIWATFSVAISPTSANKTSGSTQTFTASASGANANLSFRWTGPGGFTQSNLTGSTGTSSINITTGSGTVGTYTCAVQYGLSGSPNGNNGTSTQSHSASAALSMAQPPVITRQPVDQTVALNGAASFLVMADVSTAFQWYRDGVAIPGATGQAVGADTSVAGSFSYFVIVYNGAAATQSSTATLTVTGGGGGGGGGGDPGGGGGGGATYPSYNTISGTDVEYSAPAYFDMYRDGHYDGGSGLYGYWANSANDGTIYDGTLYDVMATSSNYNNLDTTGYFGVGVWYSFASWSGIGWGINPTGATGNKSSCTLTIQVRIRSTGQIVTSGTVTLQTQNGGVQQ
jgi:hypothetical protein